MNASAASDAEVRRPAEAARQAPTQELVSRLTEQVVRSIDDRIRAQRERMGGF